MANWWDEYSNQGGSAPDNSAHWNSVNNKAGVGGKISNPAKPVPLGPERGPWERFYDAYISASAGNPIGGGGLAREVMADTGVGLSDEIKKLPRAQRLQALQHVSRQIIDQKVATEKADPINDSVMSPNWVGKKAESLIGGVAGGVDPTYAIGFGKSVLQRIGVQGAVQGVADLGRQALNKVKGIGDEISIPRAIEAAGAGMLFQGAAEGAHGLARIGRDILDGINGYRTGNLVAKGAEHPDFNTAVGITMNSESRGRYDAVSPKGATGRLQVMPKTAKDPGYGIKPSNGTAADTERVGVQLLARHVGHYDGDMEKAWAAYNWGQGNLDRAIKAHGDDWYRVAPRETQDYVAKNMVALGKRAPAAPEAQVAEPATPVVNAPETLSPAPLEDLLKGDLGLTDTHGDPFGGEVPSQVDASQSVGATPEFREGPRGELHDANGQPPKELYRVMSKAEYDNAANTGVLTSHEGRVHASPEPLLQHVEPGSDNVLVKINGAEGFRPKWSLDNLHAVADSVPFDRLEKVAEGDKSALTSAWEKTKGFVKNILSDESGSFNPFGKKYDPNAPEPTYEPGHEPGGAIDRLSSVLQDLNKRRPEQEKLFSDQRTEQMKAASVTGKHTDGVEGLYQEMSHMKGELKRPDIAPQGDKFEPHHLDELLKIVKENPRLNMYESINARKAIADLLTSDHPNLPTRGDIELLKKALPGKLVDQLTDKSLMDKFKEGTVSTLNVPRALMASMDVSAPFRQGIFLVGRKEFWKNIGPMLKMFVNPNYYRASMDAIEAHPNYRKMVKAGLALTDTSGDISHAEEAFIGANMAEKIPLVGLGVKASERAYVGFLNKLRADTFNNLYKMGKEAGKDWKADDGAGMKALAKYINNATGRGDMGRLTQAAPLLANVFFSPRLMASRVNLLNPGTYMQKDAFVRKEAIKDLIRFGSIATSVLGLAAFAGQDVNTDPKSSDFLKIRNGNLRVGILGGFESYLRLGAGIGTYMAKHAMGEDTSVKYGQATQADKIGQFFRYKESPITSLVHDYFAGKDAVGNKFSWSSQVANRMVPLVMQDIYDVYQDKGALAAAGIAPLAVAGFGVQDYQPRAPKSSTKASKGNWYDDPSIKGSSVKSGSWYDDAKSTKASGSWYDDPELKK